MGREINSSHFSLKPPAKLLPGYSALDTRTASAIVGPVFWTRFGVVLFLLILISCAQEPWRAAYLRSVQGEATPDQIRGKLGPPDMVAKQDAGGEVWKYQFRTPPSIPQPAPNPVTASNNPNVAAFERGLQSGQSAVAAVQAKGSCVQYIVEFNDADILQTWQRMDC